jgi:tRNA pseudouridine55 synthase
MNFPEGEILYFNKPLHWTSFDLVNKIRCEISRSLNIRKIKVGHAGTLDPLATGVMIVCTGKATKEIDRLQCLTKEYIATLRLGATTPSFDMETEIDAVYDTSHITEEAATAVLQRFTGNITQIPPAYSAVKIQGNKAYDLARKGIAVTLKPRLLVIEELELLSFRKDEMNVRIVCSKGTYIRALARDIGTALNSGACLTQLQRTRIGDITLDKCLKMDDFYETLKIQI